MFHHNFCLYSTDFYHGGLGGDLVCSKSTLMDQDCQLPKINQIKIHYNGPRLLIETTVRRWTCHPT